MTDDEKKAERKRKQHESWKRWYASAKGKAYRLKMNEKRRMALVNQPGESNGT